jgi:hypothetical protein
VSMTIRRGRPPARPRPARAAPGTAKVLAAYLAAAFVLLAVVFALRPATGPAPPAPTWDYQRETVALEGGGTLNAYARWAVRTTASVTRGSIERQRDVHRLSPLDYLAGQRAASALAGWRERHRLPLEGATLAAVCALAAWGTLRRRPGRVWLAALLMLVGLTLLVTRPQTATTMAAKAGTDVPNLLLRAAATADPSKSVATAGSPGEGGVGSSAGAVGGAAPGPSAAEVVQRTVATRYWTAFVGEPLSRLQTGTTVLATAPPAAKAGVLGTLRGRVTAVGDWAVGRRGPERAVIATLALAYVLPFALALVALAMLASCAQTLVWLLALAGPLAAPLAVDPRHRRAVLRWWLVPLAAALALAAVLAVRRLLRRRPARPRALPSARSSRQPAARPAKPAILRGGAA